MKEWIANWHFSVDVFLETTPATDQFSSNSDPKLIKKGPPDDPGVNKEGEPSKEREKICYFLSKKYLEYLILKNRIRCWSEDVVYNVFLG